MNNVNKIISVNHFRYIAITLGLLSCAVFFINEQLMPAVFRPIVALLLILISIIFIPIQLIKNDTDIKKPIDVTSKIIFGVSSAYMAILALTSSDILFTVGSFIIIISSIFSIFVLIYQKNKKSLQIFISHQIVIFFLIGLTKMLS